MRMYYYLPRLGQHKWLNMLNITQHIAICSLGREFAEHHPANVSLSGGFAGCHLANVFFTLEFAGYHLTTIIVDGDEIWL